MPAIVSVDTRNDVTSFGAALGVRPVHRPGGHQRLWPAPRQWAWASKSRPECHSEQYYKVLKSLVKPGSKAAIPPGVGRIELHSSKAKIDYRVVANPLKRYNLNNRSPLVKESDGSLKIAIGPKPVAGVPESNWLPSAEGKPFSLTFRTYVPKESVRQCDWTPPPLALAK
ncbi:DUF1214 domain-containing protein [Cupriavidus lacunae]|uniref:DUF1214 domain-containing protein n=1 Tax=Cupriavidus lacunae TaxID=2666307 RepID=A0A370NQ42_9BURK|nr:hypothetical protein DN412_24385 [Cupriavidus lacunae]